MRQELKKMKDVLGLLKTLSEIFENHENITEELVDNILDGVETVNTELYGCFDILSAPMNQVEDIDDFQEKLNVWLQVVSDELNYREKILNKTDYQFHDFMTHIKEMSEQALIEESVGDLQKIREASEQKYQLIRGLYSEYYFFWGFLDLDKGNIELIENRVGELKGHWNDFKWLYDNLEDYRSKKVLYGILCYWLHFDISAKNKVKECNYDDYFDYDILTCGDKEVFVDLGAWVGDSVESFIDNYLTYKRIYCYEMTQDSMEKAKQRLANYDNIIYRQVAVGNMNGTTTMFNFNDTSSNIVSPQGNTEIPIVRVDDDIKEPITFLKMDIEGCELEAMMGSEQHIRNDKPKLAICTYHNNHHIYEIPKLMREYNPDYKLYMRYNGDLDDPRVCEYVTFGI